MNKLNINIKKLLSSVALCTCVWSSEPLPLEGTGKATGGSAVKATGGSAVKATGGSAVKATGGSA